MAAKKKASSKKKASLRKTTTRRVSRDVFDLDQLNEIIQLMKDHGLTEVDLEQDQRKLRLSRGGAPGAIPVAMPAAPPFAAVPSAPAGDGGGSAAADNANTVTIDSPMVGTFYSKPNPDSPNFVKVGDHVGPETIVCIIEAMKVFNEIPAEVSGKVVAILVDNEASVEFGKPLYKIDTSQ